MNETPQPPIKLEPLDPGRLEASRNRWWRRKEGPRALRDIRERQGIPLETIAERTRIPRHHLEAIERGDVASLPPGVYAKSWARAYGNEIGVDEQTVLAAVAPVAETDESIEEIRQATLERERLVKSAEPGASMIHLMRRAAVMILVLAVLVVAGLFVWERVAGDRSGAGEPQPVGTSGVSGGGPGPR